ncbi:MAG: family 10 glycosylhydrolase [Gemmatimonadetes bacterium]|nr:family 10 glycosylhydrolase [Gemmatimonadota bacterium]
MMRSARCYTFIAWFPTLALVLSLGACTVVDPSAPSPRPSNPQNEEAPGRPDRATDPRGQPSAGDPRAGDPGARATDAPGGALRNTAWKTPGGAVAGYRARPLPAVVRALWVVRTTLTDPDSIRVMAERAAEAGFNTLVVQVRGRGDAYYESRWEPTPATVLDEGPTFDPLAVVIDEAHQRGMGVHAWVNGHLVGGLGGLPTDPTHLIRARPDLLAVPRALARDLYDMDPWVPRYAETILQYSQQNTDRVEGLYSTPSHPEVKEHLYSVWMDLVESYELDGLHFDYIRYPSADFDYSRDALERFRNWVTPRISPARRAGLDRALQSDPLAYTDSLPGPWGEFRRAQITGLVERIYHGVKKRRPDLTVSAAVFPNFEDAYLYRFQDWKGWLAGGILDAVAPMAYTPDNEIFEAQIGSAIEAAGRNRVWAGVGIYQNTYRGTLDKIRIAGNLGTRGVILFSYDWAVTEGEGRGNRTFLQRIAEDAFRER